MRNLLILALFCAQSVFAYLQYCGPDPKIPLSLPTLNFTGSSNYVIQKSIVFIRHGDRTTLSATVEQTWSKSYPPKIGCYQGDKSSFHCSQKDVFAVDEDPRDFNFSVSFLLRKKYHHGKNTERGTCFSGQLTDRGYQQQLNNGQMLRNAYINHSNFLTPTFTSKTAQSEIHVRADDIPRTIESVTGLLSGLYPDAVGNTNVASLLNLETQELVYDPIAINPGLCPVMISFVTEAKKSQAFQNYMSTVVEPLAKQVGAILNLNLSADSLGGVGDCISPQLCHGMTLPSGITEDLLNQIWITSSWIQNYYTSYPTYQQFGQASVGLLVREMLERLQQEQSKKLFLYSGHDSTLMALKAAYGLQPLTEMWTPYASHFIFEIYQDSTNGNRWVRLISNTQELQIPGCTPNPVYPNLCEFGDFIQITTQLIPVDPKAYCQWNSEQFVNQQRASLEQAKLTGFY